MATGGHRVRKQKLESYAVNEILYFNFFDSEIFHFDFSDTRFFFISTSNSESRVAGA